MIVIDKNLLSLPLCLYYAQNFLHTCSVDSVILLYIYNTIHNTLYICWQLIWCTPPPPPDTHENNVIYFVDEIYGVVILCGINHLQNKQHTRKKRQEINSMHCFWSIKFDIYIYTSLSSVHLLSIQIEWRNRHLYT